MKKRLFTLGVILCLLLLPTILANSVDSEMNKITHYAEEYETGNIDYVKLMLYISSAREGLNGVLGATGKEMGGIVKQDKLTEILGEPNEKTRWVWVEGEDSSKFGGEGDEEMMGSQNENIMTGKAITQTF